MKARGYGKKGRFQVVISDRVVFTGTCAQAEAHAEWACRGGLSAKVIRWRNGREVK